MKNTIAHYIKEGTYEYLLRIHCSKPKVHYKQWYFMKADGWTLLKVRQERNRMCKEFEENGIRATGPPYWGGRIPSNKLTLEN